ncbi:hypothetical protein ACOP3E_04935 [Escherichia coli]
MTVVNIGTATLNAGEKGPEVYITMKPTDKYDKNCLEQSARVTNMAWVGNLNTNGIMAQSGDMYRSGAYLEMIPLNDQKKKPVTNRNSNLVFDPDLLLLEGYQFKLQLVGGKSLAVFTVLLLGLFPGFNRYNTPLLFYPLALKLTCCC